MKCGHVRSISYQSFVRMINFKCKNCEIADKSLNYETIKKRFEEFGYILVTSQEEFDQIVENSKVQNKLIKLTLLGSCGHERIMSISDLKKCKTDKCIDCSASDGHDKLRSQQSSSGIPTSSQSEYDSFSFFQRTISGAWDIVMLNPGTRGDCVIRPNTIADGK